jgi:predicted enzyme related to lactoylglutathione lyase
MKLLNWFQIPATDIDRAAKFYEAVMKTKLERMEDARMKRAFFPMDMANHDRTGGELVQSPDDKPSPDGVTIYFNSDDGVDACLARVEAAGGKVTMRRTSIGEYGFISLFRDTEGNGIGVHGMT